MIKQEEDLKLSELMSKSQQGDAASFAELLRCLIPHLTSYFRKRLGHHPDAVEDLIQETLIAIHRSRASFIAGSRFGPWLYAIAGYKWVDFERGCRRILEDGVDELPEVSHLESGSEECLALLDLETLLEDIKEPARTIFLKVKRDGLETALVAKEFGISQANVKVIAHRIFLKLKKQVRQTPVLKGGSS